MNATRKHFSLRAVCAFLALAGCLLLAGCGAAVPDGMTEDEVKSAAENTIELLAAEDYTALLDTMTEDMAALGEDAWREVWQPVHEQLGALDEVKSHTLAAKDGYAVDVAVAAYENGELTFTLSYDGAYRLAGLYMK